MMTILQPLLLQNLAIFSLCFTSNLTFFQTTVRTAKFSITYTRYYKMTQHIYVKGITSRGTIYRGKGKIYLSRSKIYLRRGTIYQNKDTISLCMGSMYFQQEDNISQRGQTQLIKGIIHMSKGTKYLSKGTRQPNKGKIAQHE